VTAAGYGRKPSPSTRTTVIIFTRNACSADGSEPGGAAGAHRCRTWRLQRALHALCELRLLPLAAFSSGRASSMRFRSGSRDHRRVLPGHGRARLAVRGGCAGACRRRVRLGAAQRQHRRPHTSCARSTGNSTRHFEIERSQGLPRNANSNTARPSFTGLFPAFDICVCSGAWVDASRHQHSF
jgi:hypothetical protein